MVEALAQHDARVKSGLHLELPVEEGQVPAVSHLVQVRPVEEGEHHPQGGPDVLRHGCVGLLPAQGTPPRALHVQRRQEVLGGFPVGRVSAEQFSGESTKTD